ncbi:hypothetical protein HDU97_002997 [Phlyctochytrium planicorne]|nr:hypothetical protein HDU97_002997 [Phlyctochytrium planicorne]
MRAYLREVEKAIEKEKDEHRFSNRKPRTNEDFIKRSSLKFEEDLQVKFNSSFITEGSSSIKCFPFSQTIPLVVCDATNVAIKLSSLSPKRRWEDLQNPVNVQASCKLNEKEWFRGLEGEKVDISKLGPIGKSLSGGIGWLRHGTSPTLIKRIKIS